MSFFKEFQCCNPFKIILQKDLIFSNDSEEQNNLNSSDIIINDEYIEIPYLIKVEKKDSPALPKKTQTKSTFFNESLNAVFLSSEIPTNIETAEPTITKLSSADFSSVKIKHVHTNKLSAQILRMRQYLLDNSF